MENQKLRYLQKGETKNAVQGHGTINRRAWRNLEEIIIGLLNSTVDDNVK